MLQPTPCPISATTLQAARRVRLLVLDVDGVLTDGRIFLRDNGEEIKAFHTLDGHGIKMLQKSGVAVAIITGRNAPAVAIRAQQLGIEHYFAGISDKAACFLQLIDKLSITPAQCAGMGDDVPDLAFLSRCALSAAPSDAHHFVRTQVHLTTTACGGKGAVREFCELIMMAQGTLSAAFEDWMA